MKAKLRFLAQSTGIAEALGGKIEEIRDKRTFWKLA